MRSQLKVLPQSIISTYLYKVLSINSRFVQLLFIWTVMVMQYYQFFNFQLSFSVLLVIVYQLYQDFRTYQKKKDHIMELRNILQLCMIITIISLVVQVLGNRIMLVSHIQIILNCYQKFCYYMQAFWLIFQGVYIYDTSIAFYDWLCRICCPQNQFHVFFIYISLIIGLITLEIFTAYWIIQGLSEYKSLFITMLVGSLIALFISYVIATSQGFSNTSLLVYVVIFGYFMFLLIHLFMFDLQNQGKLFQFYFLRFEIILSGVVLYLAYLRAFLKKQKNGTSLLDFYIIAILVSLYTPIITSKINWDQIYYFSQFSIKSLSLFGFIASFIWMIIAPVINCQRFQ